MFNGVCPTCSGPVDSRLEYCENHDSRGPCDTCGWLLALLVRFRCRVCEDYALTDPKKLPLFHPAVIAFYEDHGITTRVHTEDPGSARDLFDLMIDHDQELVSGDPLRVVITVSVDGDDVRVMLDETASVVDVRR